MQTAITIDGKKYKAVLKGKTYRKYRVLFNRDLLVEQTEARIRAVTEDDKGLIERIGTDFIERLTYAAVYAGDESIEPFDKFVDSIDDYVSFIDTGFQLFFDLVSAATPTEEPTEEKDETPEYAKKNEDR